MKKLLLSFVALSMYSSFATAGTGPTFMCNDKPALTVIVRANPHIGKVDIIKADPDRPSYTLSCVFDQNGSPMLSCTEEGGRGFFMYNNGAAGMTGKYVGRVKTTEVSCIFSGSSQE
ncbi:MAG: hypothetical protein HQK53_00335 [Oligoflexia bacterium]|nr:hypothetical protein [Oligoflexia bacterium]